MPVDETFRRLPFDQAIDFFADKINVDTEGWRDIWQEEHDVAFMVAGAKGQVLADFRDAVDRVIAEGGTRKEFLDDFDRIVANHGWDYHGGREWRANLIYGTNLRTSYAAARYGQMSSPAMIKARPYWQWRHGDSRAPRPLHLALDQQVFPATSEFWRSMYPPSGWGCKCRVVSLSSRDLDRMGLKVEEPPQMDSLMTVKDDRNQDAQVRVQAEEGWGYAPGAAPEPTRQRARQKIFDRFPQPLQGKILADLVKQGKKFDAGFSQRVGEPFDRFLAAKAEFDQAELGADSARLAAATTALEALRDESLELGQSFRSELLGRSKVSRAQALLQARQSLKGVLGLPKQALQDLADIIQLTQGQIQPPPQIRRTADERSYTSGNAIFLGQDIRRLSDGEYDPTTIYHEMGHFLEDGINAQRNKAATLEFLKTKATGETASLRSITGSKHYEDTEQAYPDHYLDPYVGRFYPDGSTEVTSVGLEQFAYPGRIVQFAAMQPQHFQLMLAILEGSP
ncbi:hypothetical protein GS597_09150 [Synechococcales cyanobacterium C]|uniref:Phage head morphogenesis domain-containing protein n=1 Tax=Petrachloros mirabilis ULC683 TaxID=2781853 RepID=A0A8K2A7Y1_9CYAN|nr:phage minor head protein [Petrachloros mirabilis]NCJ06669.1 hypothetical protein [Petrachloros mirabilis ULC683]